MTALAGGRGFPRRRRAVVIEPGQGQEVRGLQVVSGEAFHRVTGFRIRSRQARDLARRLATGTGSLIRMRGTTSTMTTAMAMARPTACAPTVAPGS